VGEQCAALDQRRKGQGQIAGSHLRQWAFGNPFRDGNRHGKKIPFQPRQGVQLVRRAADAGVFLEPPHQFGPRIFGFLIRLYGRTGQQAAAT